MVTGLVLIIRPSLFVWLLFAAELSEAGQALGRLAGFALLALAVIVTADCLFGSADFSFVRMLSGTQSL